MKRYLLVAIIAFIKMNPFLVGSQEAYEVNLQHAIKDKALHGHTFLNLTHTPILDCFEYCVKNCLCMSFQICQNTQCQLVFSNRFLTPSALLPKHGCIYYDISPRKQAQGNKQQSPGTCLVGHNCCTTSKPCLNGGSCDTTSIQDDTPRFKCRCPVGYGGRRCETCAIGYTGTGCQDCAPHFTGDRCNECAPHFTGDRCNECVAGYTNSSCDEPIKSCRAYNKGNRTAGIYEIFDAKMKLTRVFCDFDGNSSMAWTLIQSYELKLNKGNLKGSFVKDRPVDEDTPSWTKYRLSKPRMQSIYDDSTKWRVTCDYQSSGTVNYTDYVRVSNEKVNILTFNGKSCVEVEYIDIRGQHCSNCTALMLQSHNRDNVDYYFQLHFDSYNSAKNFCDFRPTGSLKIYGKGEDNFGYYDCTNEKHRCSASPNATTQTWLGGDLN